MECVKRFLDDSYQYRLRLLAQSKSERYEDTIENYKKIFIAHFKLVNECGKICKRVDTCFEIRKVVNSIRISEIEEFFDTIKKIYLYWIDAKLTQAIDLFTNLLKRNNLLRFERKVGAFEVFFKGRESEQVLTSKDMFHIPFNKRYLIQNQRYSLTGQPMLYIGSSVVDIVEEIGVKHIDKLKLSTVYFLSEDVKIFDLKNNISEIINTIWLDKLLGRDVEYGKADFFKLILSSVCSFPQRQELSGYSFCEEYVLPQLLAQILKNEQYDGIAYYSTKYYEGVTHEDADVNMAFKENLAIFTNICTESVYDRKLLGKLFISTPVDKNNIYLVSMKELKEVVEKINQGRNQGKITCAEKIVSSFERIYGTMKINGEKYEDSEYGKLHMYEVYTVLNQILVDGRG